MPYRNASVSGMANAYNRPLKGKYDEILKDLRIDKFKKMFSLYY